MNLGVMILVAGFFAFIILLIIRVSPDGAEHAFVGLFVFVAVLIIGGLGSLYWITKKFLR